VIHERGPAAYGAIRAYSFDDCERNRDIKKYAMEMYRLFDSDSLLTISDISFAERAAKNRLTPAFSSERIRKRGTGTSAPFPDSTPGRRGSGREARTG
jgi:hypothetical protein